STEVRSLFSRGSTGGRHCPEDQAVRARRPLRRRPARIARPARVLMRWRKPCVLARLRVLGWKVCLLTSCSIDRGQRWVPPTAVPVAARQAEPPSSSLPRTDGVVRSPLLRRGEHGEVHTEPARTGAWTRNTGHSIVGATPNTGQTAVAHLTRSTRARTAGERRVSPT